MKRYEKETREVTRAVLKEWKCDLCGGEMDEEEGTFDVAETTVQMRTGVSYPEGGDVTYTRFDICTKCFQGKLVPWLEANGALPRISEADC